MIQGNINVLKCIKCRNWLAAQQGETAYREPWHCECEIKDLQNAVQDLHAIVTTLAYFFRDNLPHEYGHGEMRSSNPNLSSETRTQLAVIEDEIKQSDEIFRKVFGLRNEGKSKLTAASPEVRDTMKEPGDVF